MWQLGSGSVSKLGCLRIDHWDEWRAFFKGQPGLFLFIFFFSHDKCSTNLTINDKSVDGVLGTRTQGGRMVDVDKSTKLRRHPAWLSWSTIQKCLLKNLQLLYGATSFVWLDSILNHRDAPINAMILMGTLGEATDQDTWLRPIHLRLLRQGEFKPCLESGYFFFNKMGQSRPLFLFSSFQHVTIQI